MKKILLSLTILLLTLCTASTRAYCSLQDSTSLIQINSLDDLFKLAIDNSLDIHSNKIRINKAQKAKLAAALGTLDITGNLFSSQFINNTRLGVNVFPAEVFGGQAGTFQEIQTGVQYNTNINNYIDIKIFNLPGYNNLKLSKINIDLVSSESEIHIHEYKKNLASLYYNILNIQKQIEHTETSIEVSDTLLLMVKNKLDEGLSNTQDYNSTKINHIKLEESLKQLEYLEEQYYLSLEALCDLKEGTKLSIINNIEKEFYTPAPIIQLNNLKLNNYLFKEKYALQNLKSAKQAFLPTVSFQFSNSWNLYNTEFQPLSGNWINSNYIGLKINLPIPNTQLIANKSNTENEYKIAQNDSEKERINAKRDVEILKSEFYQAQSQVKSDEEVLKLENDNYLKNLTLYEEGLIGLDKILDSLNAKIQAELNLSAADVNLSYVKARIQINNNQ